MRILVTNDDGIDAPGLVVAEELARELAGPEGEVVVVAPSGNRSGSGRALTYTSVLRMREVGPARHAVDGTPADCVILGCEVIGENRPFSLVLSGVNHGHNLGEDTAISGTVGAALEGAQRGIPSVAMSQGYGGCLDPRDPETPWRLSRQRGASVLRSLVAAIGSGFAHCLSVNFPPVEPGQERGVRLARLSRREGPGVFAEQVGRGMDSERLFDLRYRRAHPGPAPDDDRTLSRAGWITVTPIHDDLTAQNLLSSDLAEALRGHA